MTPKKLKDDAIVEALCLVQFTTSMPSEILIGRLSDVPEGDHQGLTRLPFADIPAPLRRQDPQMRAQPLYQIRYGDGWMIQFGEASISGHVTGIHKYPGWEKFKHQLATMVDHLYSKVSGTQVTGLSLRYLNAIVAKRHHVNDANDLRVEVRVAEQVFRGPMNLNFLEEATFEHVATTRIAHPKFVQGNLPKDTTVVVDVEVTSQPAFKAKDKDAVLKWIEDAHEIEKSAFFRLMPDAAVELLREE